MEKNAGRERERTHLSQQAYSIAIKPTTWKEGKPVFSPTPSSMVASMDKYQRRVVSLYSLIWVLVYNTPLHNDLHVQTRRELMKNTGLPLLELVGYPHFPSSVEDSPGLCGHFWEAKFWLRKGFGVEWEKSSHCREIELLHTFPTHSPSFALVLSCFDFFISRKLQ
jgi:hypothetical protein